MVAVAAGAIAGPPARWKTALSAAGVIAAVLLAPAVPAAPIPAAFGYVP